MENSVQGLTLETLPKAFERLTNDVCEIKRLLLEKSNGEQPNSDCWFDLNELVKYDPEKRSKPTFYGYIQRQLIPYHKRGKKLLFLKSEIDEWLKQGRKKTIPEIQAEADTYLKKKGGNNV